MQANPKLLQLIIDDPNSTNIERTQAKLALGALTTAPKPAPLAKYHRRRNANAPLTQDDQDADIEAHYRFIHDAALTARDRCEIEQGLDDSTQAILSAFGNRILWLLGDHAAEIELMIGLYQRTGSDFVKNKALEVIRHIAKNSTIDSAKMQAQRFLSEFNLATTSPIPERNNNE
jgi:hypothetical protein